MAGTYSFALAVLLIAGVGLAALLSNRLTARIKIPAPLLVLVAAAIAVDVIPDLHAPPEQTVQHLVTLALVGILFDGGLNIGWSRFRAAAAPIVITGVVGTFLTVAAAGMFIHYVVQLGWYPSLLVATAISPTDPAVVFSVLGQRKVAGRSATILEGESGANDPVGIALMTSLLAAGGVSGHAFAQVGGQFLLQMGVGAAIGLIGGRALIWFIRRIALPSEALYPLRTATCALILFGVATLAHGSGFLAVFVAGIVVGDVRAPYKLEIQRFHAALSSVGEIVAFVVLGLNVDLGVLGGTDVWIPGLLIGAVLAFILRPVFVGLCLIPVRLNTNERSFVLLAGLKGAVPILLGGMLLAAHIADAQRLYGIIVVVVAFSVLVQGSLVPTVARLLRLPMRIVEPEPWALGMRVCTEPEGVHRLTIAVGAPADGRRIDQLESLPEQAWISMVVRDNQLLPVRADSKLQAGDELLVLAPAELRDDLEAIFHPTSPRPPS